MATEVTYDTEKRTYIQKAFSYDENEGDWTVKHRTNTETVERHVFAGDGAEDAAKDAVEDALDDGDKNTQTDGVARRCSDCGWWEAIIVTLEQGEWEEYESSS